MLPQPEDQVEVEVEKVQPVWESDAIVERPPKWEYRSATIDDDVKGANQIVATRVSNGVVGPFHFLLPQSVARKEHRLDMRVHNHDIGHKY
jgi:hypothetical protein